MPIKQRKKIMAPATLRPNVGVSNETLNVVLGGVKDDVERLASKIDVLTEAIASLSRIEQRQISIKDDMNLAFAKAEAVEKRVAAIEIVMPGLVETRQWVTAGMIAGVAMILIAVASLVLYPRPPAYVVMNPAAASAGEAHIDIPKAAPGQ